MLLVLLQLLLQHITSKSYSVLITLRYTLPLLLALTTIKTTYQSHTAALAATTLLHTVVAFTNR
jgi:hypothetical protein